MSKFLQILSTINRYLINAFIAENEWFGKKEKMFLPSKPPPSLRPPQTSLQNT